MKKGIVLLPAIIMFFLCAVSVSTGETGGTAVGDIIIFGRYPQTSDGEEQAPVEWIVLDVQDGKALLLSRYGLDVKPYHAKKKSYFSSNKGITWWRCTLRAWLNDEFLKTTFSSSEQSAILIMEVDNSSGQGYSEWNTNGGINTQDRIFLLSYAEANHYLGVLLDDCDNIWACAASTDYVLTQVENKNIYENFKTADGKQAWWWWLRSPGHIQSFVADVDHDGSLGSYSASDDGVVRPALWVELSLIQ